jgi:hypothetical protein
MTSKFHGDDTIYSLDIIERLQELKDEKESLEQDTEDEGAAEVLKDWMEENSEEMETLESVIDECSGYGDFEHGETLIAEHYFTEYAEELCKEIGDMPAEITSYLVIDWEATAENIKCDYTTVEIEGTTYYLIA